MYKPFGFMDFYSVLGVDTYASDEEIKKAYHRQARLNHPDKIGFAATEDFKLIQHAYTVLSNRVQKMQHDRDLRRSRHFRNQGQGSEQKRDGKGRQPGEPESDVNGNQRTEQDTNWKRYQWRDKFFIEFIRTRRRLEEFFCTVISLTYICFRWSRDRLKLLFAQLLPRTVRIALLTTLFEWCLWLFMSIMRWILGLLLCSLIMAIVHCPGSPLDKAVGLGFAWQIAVLGHSIGIWPFVGWLIMILVRFALIVILWGIQMCTM